MDIKEIEAKINARLVEEFEIDAAALTPEANLKKDLGIDSLDVVDVVVMVDNEFGVKVKAEDIKSLQTLGNLYDFIKGRTEA